MRSPESCFIEGSFTPYTHVHIHTGIHAHMLVNTKQDVELILFCPSFMHVLASESGSQDPGRVFCYLLSQKQELSASYFHARYANPSLTTVGGRVRVCRKEVEFQEASANQRSTTVFPTESWLIFICHLSLMPIKSIPQPPHRINKWCVLSFLLKDNLFSIVLSYTCRHSYSAIMSQCVL